MKHGRKQLLRLALRQHSYGELDDKQGTRRPGSMNSHKSRSVKEFRTPDSHRTEPKIKLP